MTVLSYLNFINCVVAEKMEKLKGDLETTEQECEIINRREKLLNMRITKFATI